MRTLSKGHAVLGGVAMLAAGCLTKKPPEQHFFEQHVQPVLNSFCVGNTSPCHRIDQETGTALGNLDLTSFAAVQKRKDVLRTYGSYPHPLLLLKAVPEESVQIPYGDKLYQSEIRHAGGKPIAANSDAFYELKRWLDNDGNRDGISSAEEPRQGVGSCNTWMPPASRRPMPDTSGPSYRTFVDVIHPMLQQSCAFGTCHSSPQADFYLICADEDDVEQMAFNFGQAAGFVAMMPAAVEQSEILLRPLSPQGGGVSHTGGVFFKSRDDENWVRLRNWAEEVRAAPPNGALIKTAGETFFEEQVMPKLLQRGCALEGCHSPDGFNDFRIRSGSKGSFAPLALRRNYEALLHEFMALDTVDVKQSRAVKKNIIPTSGGTVHRAGAILEDAVPIETACPQPFDPMTNTRAYCVFKEWHRLERADRGAAVSAMAGTLPLAFVSRTPNGDDLLHFDTHAGGADLKLADAAVDANGQVTTVTNIRSALGPCAGLTPGADLDVRGPEWSYDATKLVFAARQGAASGLDLWLLDVGAGGVGTCRRLTSDSGRQVGPVRVHNFDPVFAPDGSVVYASSRSGTLTLKTFLPNANLFRVGPGLDFSNPEQMTFLLNSEIGPAFMQDGRVSFTAEKASPEFYQLSGRRINWDLTDYHPLLVQRAQSTDTFTADMQPSVDYQQATEIREGLDRNFVMVLSDVGARGGGGALATFNRSIGPFQANRTEVTFLRAVVIVDPAATGKDGTAGVYRSPFSLPNGEILASYAANVSNPASDTPKFDLVAVNERTGARRPLASDGSLSYVEAALGYKRAETMLFGNMPQLVFGGHTDPGAGDAAIMHLPDAPVLATLLAANLRRGRNVAAMDRAVALKVYEESPPSAPNPGGLMGSQQVYVSRTSLGKAGFETDHSLKVFLPARRPLILEFVDSSDTPVLTMTEEHQMGPGEYITPGPPRALFNPICGGCHGSISGSELDVAVSPDALTGASVSLSRNPFPKDLR
jgi:hypothetical protein